MFINHKHKFIFIHIPKTAGTSIENAAKSAGIVWGRFNRNNLNINQRKAP